MKKAVQALFILSVSLKPPSLLSRNREIQTTLPFLSPRVPQTVARQKSETSMFHTVYTYIVYSGV